MVIEEGERREGGWNILGPRTAGPPVAYVSSFFFPAICRCALTQHPGPYLLSIQDHTHGSEPAPLPEEPAKFFSLRTLLPESVPGDPESGVWNRRRHHSWEGWHVASRALPLQAELRGG